MQGPYTYFSQTNGNPDTPPEGIAIYTALPIPIKMESEDLSKNPLFVELKTKHTKLYQLVQLHCYAICVPQLASIKGIKLTEDLLSMCTSIHTPPHKPW